MTTLDKSRNPLATPPVSVALVVEGLADEGGTEAQAVGIAVRLAGRGHRVVVASRWPLDVEGERVRRLRAAGVEVIAPKWLGASGRLGLSEYNLRRALRLAQAAVANRRMPAWRELVSDPATLAARARDVNAILQRSLRRWIAADHATPALIHVIGRNAVPTMNTLRQLGLPIVFSQFGQFGLEPPDLEAGWLQVDACTADSATATRALAAIQGSEVVWIPSIGGFSQPPTQVPVRATRFVVINRLDSIKRSHVAVAAVAGLPGLRLDLLGDGPERPRLVRLIRDLGATERVVLHGRAGHTEVRRALDRAHGFVLASESEGTPTAVLEAMSRGRPIVTTAVGGTVDLIRDGQEGLFFDGSSEDLADKLRRLNSEPVLAARLGSGARARWEAEFAPSAIVDRYEAVYRQAIGVGSRVGTWGVR